MLPRAASWLLLLSGILLCFPYPAAGQWSRNAWIRKYRCDGHSWTNVTFGTTPFWVDSLRGQLDTANSSTQLSLSILAVHDTALFSCDELDLTTLERSVRFRVLGKHTGQVVHFNSTCPLPITPDLTPHPGHRFSTFNVEYQLDQPHKLQTLAAEYQFQTSDGQELDCAAARITPYIGDAYAVAFNLVPAGVMAIVGAAAWQTHAIEMGVDHFVDFSSALVSHQGPVWETIMDTAVYLRYLQFAFLSSSLSIEYPGFLPPIASNVAWSSLMFWRGPYDGGLTWPGVEQGMYVSNATYGMDYMVRMLGFPRIMDFMFDAFLNLAILMGALLAFLCIIHLLASRSSPQSSASWGGHSRKLARMSVTVCLSLFSMPLLAYMSNDLMLMGYLPNYRVSLIGLTILALVYVHYLITRPFLHSKRRTMLQDESSRKSNHRFDVKGLMQSLSRYIPHLMPLLQAVAIGALQDWGLVQVIVLCVTEAVILVHTALSKNVPFRFSRSKTALLSAFRLITMSMLIAMAMSIEEAARQWIGYTILCLHGIVIIPGFLATSIWRLYLVFRKDRHGNIVSLPGPSGSGQPNTELGIRLDDFNSTSARRNRPHERPYDSKRHHNVQSEVPRRYYPTASHPHTVRGQLTVRGNRRVEQTHDFYRKPRPRLNTSDFQQSASIQSHSPSSRSSNTLDSPSLSSESAQSDLTPSLSPQSPSHLLDVLSEIPHRPHVDYSFREADLFYGIPVDDAAAQDAEQQETTAATPSESCVGTGGDDGDVGTASRTLSWRPSFPTNWTKLLPALVQPKPKEKGFQVVRPGNAALRMARLQQAQARAQSQAMGLGEDRLAKTSKECSEASGSGSESP